MINGQVVAITGASSGIGRATALYLARAGTKMVLGARQEQGLLRLTEEIKTASVQAVAEGRTEVRYVARRKRVCGGICP